jgi:hypothetical protein
MVGTPRGSGGGSFQFSVAVRDATLLPVAGSVVILSFAGTGILLHATQESGTTLDCVNQTISRTTDTLGDVSFIPRFCGYIESDQVEVRASDVLLSKALARSPDYDANGRIGLSDFVLFSDDYLNHPERQRSDFDQSGSVSIFDFVLFTREAHSEEGDWDLFRPLCP